MSGRSGYLWWSAVIVLALFTLIGWLQVGTASPLVPAHELGPPDIARSFEDFTLNLSLFYLVNHARHPLLDWLAVGLTTVAFGWLAAPALPMVWWRRPAKVAPLLAAVALETTVVLLGKHLLDQPRPAFLLPDVALLVPNFENAFPSGDVALAAAVAGVVGAGERRTVKVLLALAVLLVAWKRLYTGVHFPLDCVAGALVGLAAAWAAFRLVGVARRQRETAAE